MITETQHSIFTDCFFEAALIEAMLGIKPFLYIDTSDIEPSYIFEFDNFYTYYSPSVE